MTKENTEFNKNLKNKKQELRNFAKKVREDNSFRQFDEKIVNNIKFTNYYTSSQNVMLFYPLANEINVLKLLDDKKNFSFPAIKNDKIVPLKYNGKFCKGEFNVQEPYQAEEQNLLELDLIIVPALCADKKGYRLGYGKGYYDRFIKTLDRKKTKILVPVYSKLLVDDIYAEDFDEKADLIVTENEIIEF